MQDRKAGEESLVPMIEEEEHRLEEHVEAARTQAERIIERAELDAAQRLRSVREGLPDLQEERKARARAAFEKEADELLAEASVALAALEADAESNRGAAIEAVAAAVWPLSR